MRTEDDEDVSTTTSQVTLPLARLHQRGFGSQAAASSTRLGQRDPRKVRTGCAGL